MVCTWPCHQQVLSQGHGHQWEGQKLSCIGSALSLICLYTVHLWSFLLLGSMFFRPSFKILKQSLNNNVRRTVQCLTLSKYVKEGS